MRHLRIVIAVAQLHDFIEFVRLVFENVEFAVVQAVGAILCCLQGVEQVVESPWNQARLCVGALHGVGLARVGNAIAEDQQVVAFEEVLEAGVDGALEEVLLADVVLKDVGELEDGLRQVLEGLLVLGVA